MTPLTARVIEPERKPRPTLYIALQRQFCRGEGDFRRTSHAFVAPLMPKENELLVTVPGELEQQRADAIEKARDELLVVLNAAVAAGAICNPHHTWIKQSLATLAAAEKGSAE